MTIALTNITGGAQTGFTTPSYTVTADSTEANGKQWAITALGGTQANVRAHSISDPFTVAFYRPRVPASLPNPNAVTGKYGPIPMNRHAVVVRKGVNFAANQAPVVMTMRVLIDIPAGSDAYDASNVRAAYSAIIGALNQQSAGLGDTGVSGVI